MLNFKIFQIRYNVFSKMNDILYIKDEKTQRNVITMEFNFSNINTQYNQVDVVASIAKENTSAAKSNLSSVYNSSDLNLDAAVLSISSKGSAKINAMLSKSIQLRASAVNPNLTAEDRQEVNKELRSLRNEIEAIRSEESSKKETPKKVARKEEPEKTEPSAELNVADAEKMIESSAEKMLKHADECLQTQNINREKVLYLL